MAPKSQRKWALESTIASVDNSSNTSSSASLSSQFASSLSIQQQHQSRKQTSSSSSTSARRARGDWYGISGPFLVRQAFHDLSKKCNGRVVLVSVAGTSGIWDLDHDNDDDGYYHQQSSKDDDDKNIVDMIKLFRRNGACVDLNSNPFGWNDELKTEQESKNNNDTFSTKATLNNLQSIATAIRQAASRIQSNEQQSQQPIPIIFDSLTPLLHLHGAQRIAILLKSLGRTSSLLDNNNNNNNNNNSSSSGNTTPLSSLSPIIVPILYESISPSDHRTLEDCADAMVHLNLMDSSTTTSSANFNVEAKDDNSVVVVSGVMDLVRRGGGGSNGLGGKLMRHCVPVHILRSVSTATMMGDLRDSCYWIVGSDNTDDNERDGDATEKKGKKQTSSTLPSTAVELGQSQSTENSSRPKIYLEDDDPDFQDYDEDDDLDL